jgi:hypothetical protein
MERKESGIKLRKKSFSLEFEEPYETRQYNSLLLNNYTRDIYAQFLSASIYIASYSLNIILRICDIFSLYNCQHIKNTPFNFQFVSI